MSVNSAQAREAGAVQLTDDGISEQFFELLWSKDELNFGPSINIPDTIVYKFGQPTNWYFTANNGRVKRKNRGNLLNARIEECFTKHVLGYDIIASFVSVHVERDPVTGAVAPSTIEFLDHAGLSNFLYNRKREDSNGILQRFIEPKGTKNEVIRAIWSPKVCLLERAENIHQLHDHRYGLYERCVTLEGPEYYITSAPLRGPVLAGQIQKLCESVVSHISEVTFAQKQVTRIVINFKVDSRDKIWLLYTTSIRLNDMLDNVAAGGNTGNLSSASVAGGPVRTLVNIDSVISLPNTVNLNPTRSYDRIVPKTRVQCISCAKETLDDMRHPITYKSVLKHYEHVLHIMTDVATRPDKEGTAILDWPPDQEVVDAAGGVGFGCLNMVGEDDALVKVSKIEINNRHLSASEVHIPPILRYLHPKLSGKSFYQCKRDPLFLYKTVTVCEPCYLVYAEFTTMLLRMGGDLSKLLTPDPAAVSSLNDGSHASTANHTRPSSADWRAMSTLNRSTSEPSGQFNPSANHRQAKNSAIGLRSSDARHKPSMPKAIRKGGDTEPLQAQYSIDSYGSMLQIPGNINTQMSLGRSASLGSMSGMPPQGHNLSGGNSIASQEPLDMSAMIVEREKHFFKEIARNPQLKDQHPLMHLISAQQKLKMVDEQSGVLMSKEASRKESVFGTRYGKQGQDKFEKFGIYTIEQPYIMKGELILPSKYNKLKKLEQDKKKQEKMERLRRKKARQAQMEAPITATGTDNEEDETVRLADLHGPDGEFSLFAEESTGGDVVSTKSAKKHRNFLRDTLKKVESEVDKSVSYIQTQPLTAEQRAPSPKKESAPSSAKANSKFHVDTSHGDAPPSSPAISPPKKSIPRTESMQFEKPDSPAAPAPSSSSLSKKNTSASTIPPSPLGSPKKITIKETPTTFGEPLTSDQLFNPTAGTELPPRSALSSSSSRPTTTSVGKRTATPSAPTTPSGTRSFAMAALPDLTVALSEPPVRSSEEVDAFSINSKQEDDENTIFSTESQLLESWGIEAPLKQMGDAGLSDLQAREDLAVVKQAADSLRQLMLEDLELDRAEHQQPGALSSRLPSTESLKDELFRMGSR